MSTDFFKWNTSGKEHVACFYTELKILPDILYKLVEFVLYGSYLRDVESSLTWCRSLVHTINVLAVIMTSQDWCNGTGRNYMNSWVLQLPALNRFRLGGEQQGLSFFLQFTRKSLFFNYNLFIFLSSKFLIRIYSGNVTFQTCWNFLKGRLKAQSWHIKCIPASKCLLREMFHFS